MRDPFVHAEQVGRQLAAWALLSVVTGAVALYVASVSAAATAGSAFLAAFGMQCLIWGAIDGLIAWFGARDARRRTAAGERHDPVSRAAFGRRLLRLLRLNAGLDVLYVLVGLGLMILWRTPEGLGHGVGVLVQGGFLLLFDTWHGWFAARRAHGDGAAATGGDAGP